MDILRSDVGVLLLHCSTLIHWSILKYSKRPQWQATVTAFVWCLLLPHLTTNDRTLTYLILCFFCTVFALTVISIGLTIPREDFYTMSFSDYWRLLATKRIGSKDYRVRKPNSTYTGEVKVVAGQELMEEKAPSTWLLLRDTLVQYILVVSI